MSGTKKKLNKHRENTERLDKCIHPKCFFQIVLFIISRHFPPRHWKMLNSWHNMSVREGVFFAVSPKSSGVRYSLWFEFGFIFSVINDLCRWLSGRKSTPRQRKSASSRAGDGRGLVMGVVLRHGAFLLGQEWRTWFTKVCDSRVKIPSSETVESFFITPFFLFTACHPDRSPGQVNVTWLVSSLVAQKWAK